MGDTADRNLTAGELRHKGERRARQKRVEELLREAVSDGRGERVNAGAYWLAERLADCESAEAQLGPLALNFANAIVRAEQAEAERDRLKADMDMLFREVSCNRCRSPMTAGCYACDAIQARAERDAARAKLAAVREYAEDRELVGVPVEGFAGAVLALLDGAPREGGE